MVNYKILNNNQTTAGASILEIKTDQIVLKGLEMCKAKEMVRHLNFGGGFDGCTPTFFLTR